MSDLTWTMNCILFGARIIKLVGEGKDEKVKDELKNLTSEIDDKTPTQNPTPGFLGVQGKSRYPRFGGGRWNPAVCP